MPQFDVVIIGAGPGGYVAAIRCAQLGLKTACVAGWPTASSLSPLGGTCLNIGCIPSKALLDSSHHFDNIRQHAAVHGINVSGVGLDLDIMLARKDAVVATLTQGIAGLFRKHRVELFRGRGRLQGGNNVTVTDLNGNVSETLHARNIIIATGAEPVSLPQAPVDGQRIVDSTGALSFDEVPARLGVVGAGAIGLELGSVWRRLGSQVVLLEAMDNFLAAADAEIAQEARRTLVKQGLDLRLGARLTGTRVTASGVEVQFERGGKAEVIEFDRLIVAVGRKPHTAGLGAAAAGLQLDDRGRIVVDVACRTNLPQVYAIGDVIAGPMLAHRASEEGVAVAERIAGKVAQVDHALVPWVIYTWPEVAWVGKTEHELKAAGRSIRTGKFRLQANGRARAMEAVDGLVKIVADAATDEVLGVHIFGAAASELIAEAALAMAFSASSEDIARTIHAHPTLAEALHEAALAVDGRALHS
ncbi:MAG: dihydrolipoyl dehydrogenase [Gammaproteobacteria bacterium]|nr:dihydrolipoyl dehydrogenase [Gammaproteobacteria bacterium]